jgi:hypothetical protein
MKSDLIDSEIDANYDHYWRHLSEFFDAEQGRVALLKSGQIVRFFDSVGEANRHARAAFPDGLYSLQPVIAEPVVEPNGTGSFSF